MCEGVNIRGTLLGGGGGHFSRAKQVVGVRKRCLRITY